MGALLANSPALRGFLCVAWPITAWATGDVVRPHRLEKGGFAVTVETANAEAALPRFDATALVSAITWGANRFLTGEGLVDEFGLEGMGVLGFDEAELGDTFIKIGVGSLERDLSGRYRFQHRYPRRASFPVEVIATEDQIRVSQLSADVRGFRYAYEKAYAVEEPGRLRISYSLSNRGSRAFSFEHYNHNFFRMSSRAGMYDLRIETAFALASGSPEWELISEHAARWRGDEFPETGKFWRMPLRPVASVGAHPRR
jgi:hypothetical protein